MPRRAGLAAHMGAQLLSGAGICFRQSMTVHRLIANGSFGPDEIRVMSEAYEAALVVLRLNGAEDPVTELIARSIINVSASGERDPARMADRAINALGIRRPSAA
jgi:hypothetical protein